jgi:hypothetical protein
MFFLRFFHFFFPVWDSDGRISLVVILRFSADCFVAPPASAAAEATPFI